MVNNINSFSSTTQNYSQNLQNISTQLSPLINAFTYNISPPVVFSNTPAGDSFNFARIAFAAIDQAFGDLDLNSIASIGSFFFDGGQGAPEISPNPVVLSSILNQATSVVDLYLGVGETPLYQKVINIALSNLILVLSQNNGTEFTPEIILAPTAGPYLSFDITFPQQVVPSYSFNSAGNPFGSFAFYSDSRRTYLIEWFATNLAPTIVSDPLNAAPPSYTSLGTLCFFNHYHPFVGELIKRLNWAGRGISYLLDPLTQGLDAKSLPVGQGNFQFSDYGPTQLVAEPFPAEVFDFGPTATFLAVAASKSAFPGGDYAYASYNWEVFFHIPLLVATQLSENLQFDDAETWFRYIFDPTKDPEGATPPGYLGGVQHAKNCYWNFKPLNNLPDDRGLAALLSSASSPNLLFAAQLNAWAQNPFEPDVVAQLRPVAYQKSVVMKYLDHLIRRGDNCFGQNTREFINEAIQYYILADQILGEKPIVIPQPGVVLDQSYYDLVHPTDQIYGLGNANVQLENAFPSVVLGTISKTGKATSSPLPSTPYFCTPDNPTLLGYYDTVADRLYKIRHCMNIQGQVEQLALFSPPINPGLLVAAQAAGVDLSSVLNDISAAVPHYRFSTIMAKALELCGEVRSLGAALLSAMEKGDAENLALLRAGQEIAVQQAVLGVKQSQLMEANDNLAGLQATLGVTSARQTYYYDLVAGGLSSFETGQAAALAISEGFKQLSLNNEGAAAALAIIPQYEVGINGVFGSPSVNFTFGGQQLSDAARAAAAVFGSGAEAASFVASMLAMSGGWDRRAAEWAFQLSTATLELTQIQQQINAGQIRVQIATQDVTNQNLLIANASAVQSALKSKFTNQDLYIWMVGQVSAVFFQCYQMAYDLAKRAEACYRFELGVPQSSYIQFGYWDSLKQGLLAGEKLFQDLKRLEIAYLDQNQREYEISKSISLLLLDPSAFVSLKLTGQCLINLPEAYFEMDYPGHFMRRIRNVSLTIPCVTGPYTSVNCTLTLLQSRTRLNNSLPYAENPVGSDPKFSYNFSATESIATSTAQNDSGLFEVNFRDERYLPFEGSGVVSQWQVSMPPECNAFDFETITEVLINLRYTARNGGYALRQAAQSAAKMPPAAVQTPTVSTQFPKQSNLLRYFSLRHEYPTEWYKLLQPPGAVSGTSTTAAMQINLSKDRFPFQYRQWTIDLTNAQFVFVFAPSSSPGSSISFSVSPGSVSLGGLPPPAQTASASMPADGNPATLIGSIPTPSQPAPAVQGGPNCWILQCQSGDLSQIRDILMVCTYSATPGKSA